MQDTVQRQAFASALASEFLMCWQKVVGTTSHQVLTRHGELDSGPEQKQPNALKRWYLNMNMLPGDTSTRSVGLRRC